ncbi:hypothetical protein ERO13_A10G239300v2 [Gossypium hirsutum]|uniref:High chlorophyll fluorescence 153 n=2 Tax=Gossypium TaxID=3633 RepID=A0A1U8MCF3_GOSHI|nr:uncharacterized protein LOC107936335 [Gossypium hirsutum]KAB2064056.1 hypothetical protein ES319_A10G263300v1 [Gossypium barbadense]KAG4181622.1 hypothetical protein ERO13_A10G239300v2 [Gossypium hirsutum]
MGSHSIITSISSAPPSLPLRFVPEVVAFSGHLSHRKTRGLLLYPQTANAFSSPLLVHAPVVFAFSKDLFNRKRRGLEVVTRAGANTSSYVFAAVFPLSLLAITIFTSIKIADKLDEDFLEDISINQAVKEAEDEGDDGDDGGDDDAISLEEIVQEPVLPRTRNRPKREV